MEALLAPQVTLKINLGFPYPPSFYSLCQQFSKCVPRPGVSLSTEDLLEVLGPRLRPTESNSEGEAQESFKKPSRYFRCAPKFENHWLLESRVGTHRSGPCTRDRAVCWHPGNSFCEFLRNSDSPGWWYGCSKVLIFPLMARAFLDGVRSSVCSADPVSSQTYIGSAPLTSVHSFWPAAECLGVQSSCFSHCPFV